MLTYYRTASPPPVAERARLRIMRRILPFVFLLYIIAFLDRVNVGYAALEMTKDLGFTPEVYGFGAGIFFVGYVLLEIPGTLLVERWSARRWIGRIMISWGIVAVLMGFIHTATQFYWARFVLGAAEAGFFPGIIVYLSHWFRHEDRSKAVALFMAALPFSNLIGSPLSGVILGVNWLGLAGWRWLFIVEGIPAFIAGMITIFYLTDWPHQARWLPADEREWITAELEREKHRKKADRSYSIVEALTDRKVILLTLAYFFVITGLYGVNFWMPTIIKQLSGLPNLLVTFIAALPYAVALASMLVVGWSSDRTNERRWHTALPMVAASVGLLLSAALQSGVLFSVAAFCLAVAGLHAHFPGFWALPTSFLGGTAAAAAIGLINSVGNLGGFVGPYLVGYFVTRTNSFFAGMLFLSLSTLLAAGCILALRQARQDEIATATISQP